MSELPEVTCGECEMRFSVVFNRNPFYTGIEYCPFCGCDWDEDGGDDGD